MHVTHGLGLPSTLLFFFCLFLCSRHKIHNSVLPDILKLFFKKFLVHALDERDDAVILMDERDDTIIFKGVVE